MSDSQQGPGWWLASDGKWYPPQHVPAPPLPPPAPSPGSQLMQPGGPYGIVDTYPIKTSGLAIASMVLGIMWLSWIGSVLAVVFGHMALSQIRQNPRINGRGMAIAGVVLGWIGVGTLVLVIAVAALTANSQT